tara:strand:- start:15899 stop:16681 length:783 start_codon:yes stop_codon:yes gene_type:complete
MDIETGFGMLGKVGLGILGVVAAGLLIWWIIKEAEKAAARAAARIAAMEAFADQFGFSFVRSQDPMHDDEFSHFEIFRRGFARYAYNSIVGDIDLGEVIARLKAGDFSYKTKETYTTTDSKGRTRTRTRIVKHHFSYMILELPFPTMPDLMIRREGIFDRIASAFGKNDIDFESAEFSKKYYVKCDSRKFAYDIVNQRMIEFLLETKPGLVDIEHGRICLSDGYSVWNADRFGASLGWILKFLEHWPGFVVEDLQEGKQL